MTNKPNTDNQHNGPRLRATREEPGAEYRSPAADIYETPDAFVVLLDMPGANKESISLNLHEGSLVVRADSPMLHGENASMLFTEIATPGYCRSFRIGKGVNVDNVDAQYDLGVLTVKLYKSEEAKPREIQIK